MKPFRFRLQSILTLREQAEQTAQQNYARAVSAVEQATGRLRVAEAAILAAYDLQRAGMSAGLAADQFERFRAYALLLQERRTGCIGDLEEARKHAEQRRMELLAATQRREALNRLRTRQQRVHDYESARAEQKMLDDLAGQGQTLAAAWKNTETLL